MNNTTEATIRTTSPQFVAGNPFDPSKTYEEMKWRFIEVAERWPNREERMHEEWAALY